MKKLILVLLLTLPVDSYALDILVRAKAHNSDYAGKTAEWIASNISQKGDIIAYHDTGWAWGAKELKALDQGGQYCVLRITDKTVAQAKNYVQQHRGPGGEIDVITKRRWKVLMDTIPQVVKNACQTQGYYATTWDMVRQYVYDKVTDTTE